MISEMVKGICISHFMQGEKFFAVAIGKNEDGDFCIVGSLSGLMKYPQPHGNIEGWDSWVKYLRTRLGFTVEFDDLEIASRLQCSIVAIAPGKTKDQAVEADSWLWKTILEAK
jgi:hypothetical protein